MGQVRDGDRVVLAVLDGLRTAGLRPAPSSGAWVAPDMRLRIWRPYGGEASPIGAVLAGEGIEGGDNPLSPAAVFCKAMRVNQTFVQAMCDAYDGRRLWVDMLGDPSYLEGAAAGMALRDILFPDQEP